jgi:RNA polymerase sigma-70 factor (ECF subfamily)
MAESESVLLERFVRGGDSGAFAEIVRRYAGLVYATCMRVLADADRAADATQETFFQLMRKAGEIRGSLAGWLHRVAVRKSVDVLRDASARRRREGAYLDAKGDDDSTWRDVVPFVDEALDSLDEETRGLIVRHFLEGRSMTELADQSALSRPTISRRIDAGLTRLRAQLRKRGVLVTAATLTTLLGESTARSAPAALLQQLGKMALLGAKTAAVPASAPASSAALTAGVVAAVKTKLVIAATGIVLLGVGLYTYRNLQPPPPTSPPPVPADTGTERVRRSTEPAPAPSPSAQAVSSEEDGSSEPVAAQGPPPARDAAPPETSIEMPWRSTPTEPQSFELDLSNPEATVQSFTKAIASGDTESVMACFLPGGADYEDIQKMLYADPDDPEQQDEYQMKLLFLSLDPDAEMPMVSVEETEHGTSVAWQVTFKEDLPMEGHTFRAGDTWELDATLRQSGDSWLIDNF